MKLLEVEEDPRPKHATAKKDSMGKAVFYMNCFSVFAVVQSANYKHLAREYGLDVFHYFVLRNTALMALTWVVVYLLKIDPLDLPEERSSRQWAKLILIRSLAGHFGFFAFNLGLQFAPVSVMYVFFNTNPFLISVLALVVNGESIARFELVGMVLCFVGILVLSRSALADINATGSEVIGYAGALFCGFCFAICAVVNRQLKSINPFVVCLFHGTIGLVLSIVINFLRTVVLGQPFTFFDYPARVYVQGQAGGFSDAVGVVASVVAFMSDSSGFVSLVGYVQVVYGFFFDVFVFKTVFSTLQLLSALFILCVTISVVYLKLKANQAAAKQAQAYNSPSM